MAEALPLQFRVKHGIPPVRPLAGYSATVGASLAAGRTAKIVFLFAFLESVLRTYGEYDRGGVSIRAMSWQTTQRLRASTYKCDVLKERCNSVGSSLLRLSGFYCSARGGKRTTVLKAASDVAASAKRGFIGALGAFAECSDLRVTCHVILSSLCRITRSHEMISARYEEKVSRL